MGPTSCSTPSGVRRSSGSPTGACARGRLVWFGVAAIARSGARVIPESLLTRLLLAYDATASTHR